MNHEAINSEAERQKALAILVSQGFEIKDLVAQQESREATASSPTQEDLRYPLTTPDSWLPHFESREPLLSTSTLRIGARLTLTPGQRATLREQFEMTPTKVVEVTRLECFPGTRAIRELVLRSDLHVPESKRKHILVHCRITSFGKWYGSSIELDKAKEEEKAALQDQRAQRASAKGNKKEDISAKALAESYLQYL